ncbi:hypothetical protein [Gordonia sp. NB41Y]|uniref:hypothetical protein n=1 Tax=Gordonia sp. NB41Y TaxID=875808 RepID=UPI0006B17EF3|nr:hypothetical protein [Gordonia sp. NB41Y]EMP10830.2 hypothetical protein ISGA_4982 [Gordonia sp. NB41Y]WLP92811.1 hypothetical protein Q9K23_11590 [Gordonia sp. NB41Y]
MGVVVAGLVLVALGIVTTGVGVVITGMVIAVIGILVLAGRTPGSLAVVLGLTAFATGMSYAFAVENTYEYEFGTGRSSSSSDFQVNGGAIAIAVIGVILVIVGSVLNKRRVRWPSDLGPALAGVGSAARQAGAGLARSTESAITAAQRGMQGSRPDQTVTAPVPPSALHDALLAILAPSAPGPRPAGYLLENRPGLIRLAFGAADRPPLFVLEFRIAAAATPPPPGPPGSIQPPSSSAQVFTVCSTPAAPPATGIVAGEVRAEILGLIDRQLRLQLPGAQVQAGG